MKWWHNRWNFWVALFFNFLLPLLNHTQHMQKNSLSKNQQAWSVSNTTTFDFDLCETEGQISLLTQKRNFWRHLICDVFLWRRQKFFKPLVVGRFEEKKGSLTNVPLCKFLRLKEDYWGVIWHLSLYYAKRFLSAKSRLSLWYLIPFRINSYQLAQL